MPAGLVRASAATLKSVARFGYGDILPLFIQAPGSLRDLYEQPWISYGVFTGMCLY